MRTFAIGTRHSFHLARFFEWFEGKKKVLYKTGQESKWQVLVKIWLAAGVDLPRVLLGNRPDNGSIWKHRTTL